MQFFSVQIAFPVLFLNRSASACPLGMAAHSVLFLAHIALHFASAAVSAAPHRRCSPPRKKRDCISLCVPVCTPVVHAIDWHFSLRAIDWHFFLRAQFCSAGQFCFRFMFALLHAMVASFHAYIFHGARLLTSFHYFWKLLGVTFCQP